jgi:predicted Zn-ribbon and HTH transcriptional regulator
MNPATLRCPKCQSEMVQGFVLGVTHGGKLVSQWSEGPPQKSFWSVVKSSKEKPIPIGTFRCNSCGFLESYAREEFAAR